MNAMFRRSRFACIAGVLLSLQVVSAALHYAAIRWGGPQLFPPTTELHLVVFLVGGWYSMLLATILPALVPAAAIMRVSPFARPSRVLGATVAAWWVLPHLAWWFLEPPHWELFNRSAPAVALACEGACAFALAGLAMLTLYLLSRGGRRSISQGSPSPARQGPSAS